LNTLYHKQLDDVKFKSCIINTMVRDNIHIYQTNNMNETCQFIADILQRLPKYIDILSKELISGANENNDITYTNSLKIKKKDNVNSTVCFINQLAQITGVSTNSAQIIAEKYKSMQNLIIEYEKTENKEKMLADIIVISNRKLGPVVSKRIYQFLYNIS